MWGLWFFPLVICLFVAGAALGALWFFSSRKASRPNLAAVVAVPFGCAAIPFGAFALLALIGNLLQKDDSALFEEIFGYRSTITGDRMLFDDFGRGRDREIFMRAEPTDAERKKLMMIPHAVESEFTRDQFIARGASEGFLWWMSDEAWHPDFCQSARIFDAHGFRGWVEFRVAECLDAGTEFPASENVGHVYVIASRRTE